MEYYSVEYCLLNQIIKPENDDLQPFKGVCQYVENNDIAGLDKVPTDTKEAILNKLSMSDGKGGRIGLGSQ